MMLPGRQSDDLDKKVADLVDIILAGPTKKPAIAEAQALTIVDEDKNTNLRPLPVKPKKRGANSDWTRAKALRILELRVQGLSFDEIAAELDYKSGRHARSAYQRLMDKHEKESIESLRELQNERLEMAWRGLAPKVIQGRERAVEVAMKVLERQARLQGIDAADQPADKVTNQAIQINIMPHPNDPQAQAMVIDHAPRPIAALTPKNDPGT
jgi:hypothetical protein